VLAAVGERYYKVTAEALRVCGELVKAIRPNFDNVRPLVILFLSCSSSVSTVDVGYTDFTRMNNWLARI
jgi:hypothetical protein